MGSYIVLIFVSIVIYSFYLFLRTKLDLYLMLGAIGWYGMLYSSSFGFYQLMHEPFKSIVNFITALIVLQIFVSYFKKLIQEYIDYNDKRK